MPLPILRAFTASTLACTRCGSTDVHPLAGAFGPVIGLLGVMRHGCRGCRRAFWIRADAGTRRPTPASEAPPTAKPPGETPRPADAALDFEVTPTTHENKIKETTICRLFGPDEVHQLKVSSTSFL